jgi:hypothetical protein
MVGTPALVCPMSVLLALLSGAEDLLRNMGTLHIELN